MGNAFPSSPSLCGLQSSHQDLLKTKTKTQVSSFESNPHTSSKTPSTPTKSSSFLRESLSAALAFVRHAFQDLVDEFSGTSVVLSELEEAWLHDTLAEIDAARSRRLAVARAADRLVSNEDDAGSSSFLGPNDAVVAMLPLTSASIVKNFKTVKRLGEHDNENDDDDNASCTTETTDAMSDVEAYDDSDVDDDSFLPLTMAIDPVTQADQLLRLASCSSSSSSIDLDLDLNTLVYVDDYLCPCGECPHLRQIQRDVETTVTWRCAVDRGSIARVLCAFATYNEVVGYRVEMVATADECLQIWCGDEDRALTSLVRLYDQLPTCVNG
ncbi:hypothetical protein PINS_up011981 [Pythium insidiosum]|nr:hypothetical protein PINS_up011981 [Pythium insidiosum]